MQISSSWSCNTDEICWFDHTNLGVQIYLVIWWIECDAAVLGEGHHRLKHSLHQLLHMKQHPAITETKSSMYNYQCQQHRDRVPSRQISGSPRRLYSLSIACKKNTPWILLKHPFPFLHSHPFPFLHSRSILEFCYSITAWQLRFWGKTCSVYLTDFQVKTLAFWWYDCIITDKKHFWQASAWCDHTGGTQFLLV